jgi:hypothetical protein
MKVAGRLDSGDRLASHCSWIRPQRAASLRHAALLTLSRMAPPIIMAPLSADGTDEVMDYRSAAGQTLARSQRVKGIKGLSREIRAVD